MSAKATNAELPQLPKLPDLTGEEAYEAWYDALISHLIYHDLDDIVLGKQKAPVSTSSPGVQMNFKMKQILAYTMIATSIKPIMSKLEAMGLIDKTAKNPIDPRSLFDAVVRWYSNISAAHMFRLVKELTEIKHSDFPNLDAFLDRALWLRRRLQSVFFDVSDEFMDMLLLKGISSYDDVWVKMILHNKDTGCLTEGVASLIAKKASEQKIITDTSKDIFPIKTTEEKGTEVKVIKTHEKKSAQTAPVDQTKTPKERGAHTETIVPNETRNNTRITKTVHSATSILDEDIPAEANNLKTLKPSSIVGTPIKDTAAINNSSITDSNNVNKLSTKADNNISSPQSGINSSQKTPITKITTPSPTPNGAKQSQKAPIAFSTQPFNKNAYRPTVASQPFNPLAYRPKVAAQAFNPFAYRPSNMKPSSSVAKTGNQTGNTPQHVSCFGPRRVANNVNIGAQNTTHKGPQQVPQNGAGPINGNYGPLNAVKNAGQKVAPNATRPSINSNTGPLNGARPALNGNNGPQHSGQDAQKVSPDAGRPSINGNNGPKIGPQNGPKPVDDASILAAFLASRNKHVYKWLDGIPQVGTDETAWLDPNVAEDEQSIVNPPACVFQNTQYAKTISVMSSLSVSHFPPAVRQQYAALPAAAPARQPKPHDIPDWVGGLDPKARADWYRDFGPHTFCSYWVEVEEKCPFLRIVQYGVQVIGRKEYGCIFSVSRGGNKYAVNPDPDTDMTRNVLTGACEHVRYYKKFTPIQWPGDRMQTPEEIACYVPCHWALGPLIVPQNPVDYDYRIISMPAEWLDDVSGRDYSWMQEEPYNGEPGRIVKLQNSNMGRGPCGDVGDRSLVAGFDAALRAAVVDNLSFGGRLIHLATVGNARIVIYGNILGRSSERGRSSTDNLR
ncbi:hypothetical protein B0T20DRAFT_388517 [Sordaria brevicollis]|uniref:Uncharacterized protein n=1 Tax=Sordaria brevicollis TaxID=83679 RepID=A0AAE0PMZ5_SORBR|nr:hypothetical protein B0T20DRAFT_388517 [Sordaria brevicollis]